MVSRDANTVDTCAFDGKYALCVFVRVGASSKVVRRLGAGCQHDQGRSIVALGAAHCVL